MATFLAFCLTFLGGFMFPMFTLGCVLVHYGHGILGGFFIICSIISGIAQLLKD